MKGQIRQDGSDKVLMEDNTLPIGHFWMLLINLINPIWNNTLNSMPDFAKAVTNRLLECLAVYHFVFHRIFFTEHCRNQSSFIAYDRSFQKRIIFVVFEQRVTDENVIH